MIKLVAFDWNGTLFADTKACLFAANQVYKSFGIRPITFKQYLHTTDVPISKFYAANGIPKNTIMKNTEKISSIFHSGYEEKAKNVRTRANTRRVISWLSEHKIDSIIFSNHIEDKIAYQLKRLKIDTYFSQILANSLLDSAIKSREKKFKLEKYMAVNKINHKEIIIVGDGPEEIEIARELGVMCIAITQGQYSTSRLKAAKPDYLITDLGNIINIIREINQA